MQRLHGMVWELRREIGDKWPTPDTLDSLRFAFTEAAEAMDAYLREQGGYARNNAKQMTAHGELAQCAMMLFTAVGPDYQMGNALSWHISSELDLICCQVASVLREYWWAQHSLHCDEFCEDAEIVLNTIARYPGMDLERELTAVLDAIRQRWG